MSELSLCDPYHWKSEPLLIVISGPSGVGKDSVLQQLREQTEHVFHFVVTATSRAPRPGEVDGVDYFFYSEQDFERMIEQDELLEHALVYGQHKGIPKQQVREALASGRDVVMRVDVQGAATVRRLVPDAVLIFLSATSENELTARLRRRRSDSAEQLARRLQTARAELERLNEFDYVIINHEGQLETAVAQVMAIIAAEHLRVHPRKVRL